MSELAAAPRQTRLPALAAALALHAGVLALLILAPQSSAPPIGSSVPVNIVSQAPFTNSRPAVQAPRAQTAAAPEPKPQAPAQAPAVEPGPPAFAAPTPAVRKLQRPPPPAPQPTRVASPPARPFDFSRLQQIIETARRSSGRAASSARAGPVKAETALQARPDAGQGLSQSQMAGLEQLLERLWNPNCDVAGGSQVRLQVKFIVDLSGGLLGRPSAGGLERSGDPVVSAAALRALDAVREAAPYGEPYYGRTIIVNFDAKEACAKR